MSLRDDVLQALDADAPRSRDEVVEELGLDVRQVGNALDQLQRAGKCRRGVEGWLRVDGAPAPKLEPEIAAPPEPKAKRKYTRKAKVQPATAKPKRKAGRPRKSRAKPTPVGKRPPRAQAVNGTLSFSLTEQRQIAIERADGSGERALIGAADALRLVEFIALVRPALEG